MTERIERIETVMERTSLRRTTIYTKMKEGKFPPGFVRGRARCWLQSEIDEVLRLWAAGQEWSAPAKAA